MEGTVTLELFEFDRLRKDSERYKRLSDGIDGFTKWLHNQSTEENRLTFDFANALEEYNNSKPKHPFLTDES